MRNLARCLVVSLSFLLPCSGFAATLVPSRGPLGARVIISGTALDDAAVQVTFPSPSGARLSARLVTRSATVIEAVVPEAAASGDVKLVSGTETLETFAFTVVQETPFVKSATLVAASPNHDTLKEPTGPFVALPSGIAYIADVAHHEIRALLPTGELQLSAGTGKAGYVDGSAATAQFREPRAVAIDSARNRLYIADSGNHVIRLLTPDGSVSTFAGSGRGEDRDGVGAQAGFQTPTGLAIDDDGNLFVADSGNDKIRKITPTGDVSTIAGAGRRGFANGTTVAALFNNPQGVAVGGGGGIYVADTGNHVLRVIESGTVTTLAGTGHPGRVDGGATNAEFKEPIGLATDATGAVIVADSGNHCIRRVTGGIVSTIAGSSHPGLVDGTDLAAVEYKQPSGVAVEGPVYIADTKNDAVRALYHSVAITDVWPRHGASDGGDIIRIFGDGFVPGQTQVKIGDALASVIYVAATELLATTPPGTIGGADVSVSTPAGVVGLEDGFEYGTPFIALTISPSSLVLTPNDQQSLNVLAESADGTTTSVTGQVTWASSNSAVASVTPEGHVTAASVGSATITATLASLTSSITVVVREPFVSLAIVPHVVSLAKDTSIQLTASATRVEGGTIDVTAQTIWASSNPAVALVSASGMITAANGGTVSVSGTFRQLSDTATVTVTVGEPLPPDPAAIAPPLDQTIGTTTYDATRFLYEGPNAIQTGVAPGAIAPHRVSVVRGRVITRDGDAISGVGVKVAGYPQLGRTQTRADGAFDLAFNGGGSVVLQFEKEGVLSVERRVGGDWQDFQTIPDVVMIPLDTAKTVVTFPFEEAQLVRSNSVVDAAGLRRSTLLIPSGTTAKLVLPNSTQVAAPSLTLRSTEYSVGPLGPQTMPADLPPQSGYTYCAELSADEAMAAGAETITFSRPILQYLENFLNLPVGTIVPSGFYDDKKHAWVAAPNGRVIRITAVDNGTASIDIDGDGNAEPAAELMGLGITQEEQDKLATVYQTGQALWRIPISHLTPFDYNLPYGPPLDAVNPAGWVEGPFGVQDSCCQSGSVIETENATLGESLRIPGTPFSLQYRSSRARGRKAANELTIHVTGPSVPNSLRHVVVEVEVAGQIYRQKVMSMPNASVNFVWNGQEAYGRRVQGPQSVDVRIGFVYPELYEQPAGGDTSFGRISGFPLVVAPDDREVTLWQEMKNVAQLGVFDAKALGFGGWSISAQHVLLPASALVEFGDGRVRDASDTAPESVRITGGTGAPSGGPAITAPTGAVTAMAYAADGTLYFVDGYQIRRIDPAGLIWNFAGTGIPGYSGDGGPAVSAQINPAEGKIAVAHDGSVYLSDENNGRVRRIDPNGIITTVAGMGKGEGVRRDGVSATQSRLLPLGIAAAPDGTLYVGDEWWIRQIAPDGIISTIAGTGQTPTTEPSGTVAGQTPLIWPKDLHLDRQGRLYILDWSRVLRLDPDGRMWSIAGSYEANPSVTAGDGGMASGAQFRFPSAVMTLPDGSLIVSQDGLLRLITQQGSIDRFAGFGSPGRGVSGNLLGVSYDRPYCALSPSGDVGVGLQFTNGGGVVARIQQRIPGFALRTVLVPDQDRNLIHKFSEAGRHLETFDADSRLSVYRFEYDSAGLLKAIIDRDDNHTTIERAGNVITITSPHGLQTTVLLDANGNIETLRTPAGKETHFTSAADGLILSETSARGAATSFGYDERGYLLSHDDPGPGHRYLDREATKTTLQVKMRTAMNRITQYFRERVSKTATDRKVISPDGASTVTTTSNDGATRVTTLADGTTVTTVESADSRYGMSLPLFNTVVRLPSGRQRTWTSTRTFTGGTPADPTNISQRVETVSVNGKNYRSTYRISTGSVTSTTPAGRRIDAVLDGEERVESTQISGIAPISYSYDGFGRVESIGQNERVTTFVHGATDRLSSVSDSSGRTVAYDRDVDGRVRAVTLPGARTVNFTRDGDGHIMSIAPPSRSPHLFTYTSLGELETYTPPEGTPVRMTYDADGSLASFVRADGREIDFNRNDGDRLETISTAEGDYRFDYDAAGKLSAISSPQNVTVAYESDGIAVNSVRWSGVISGSIAIDYDSEIRPQRETVGGTDPISLSYDDDGLLRAAGALTLTRDSGNGSVLETALGIVTDSRTYNEFGEPSGYLASGSGVSLYASAWLRDDAGRIMQSTETMGGVTTTHGYEYDAAGRLKRVTTGGIATAEYDYDANGNRMAYRAPGRSDTATVDGQDRVLNYGGVSYTYSPDGELLTKTAAGVTTRYEYDSFTDLAAVSMPGRSIEYVTDGWHHRVGKRVNGELVRGYLYAGDGWRIVAELDAVGAVESRFVYATKTNIPDYMVKGGIAYKIISDQNGSPRLVVDSATGAIAQRIDYDEFGYIVADSNPGFQPFGFAGGLYDADTGLVRFGARDYDPYLGRWSTKDPLGFSGGDTNLYAYAQNDPINLIDPSGLLFGGTVNAGEAYGQAALQQYADTLSDPDASWYEKTGAAVGGFFSALWTPCTSDKTFTTLSLAYSANAYVARPFYQYYPAENPAYNSRWLTRGPGWRAPYELGDEAVEKLALPPYNSATAVRQVPSSWRHFVGGPGTVPPMYGQPGGGIQYLVGGWPR